MENANAFSPQTLANWLKEYWQFLTAIVVAIWAAFTWISDQRTAEENRRLEAAKQAQVRLLEAQKPFLDKQLELYFETAKIVGQLVTMEYGRDAGWDDVERRYDALFWSELSMVEQKPVEASMISFRDALKIYKERPAMKRQLQNRAYCLGHAIRNSIRDTWTVQIGGSPVPAAALTEMDMGSGAPPTGGGCNDPVRTK